LNEDVAKKPIETKFKPKITIFLLHDSDNNVRVQSSLNNLVDTGFFSSNIETMFFALKWQKITSSLTFDMRLKLRGMINILVHLPTNHTSSYLILNDFFVKIIKDKKKKLKFRASYDDVVAILLKVRSFYFTFLFFHIL
jgi:hypothetical protein